MEWEKRFDGVGKGEVVGGLGVVKWEMEGF